MIPHNRIPSPQKSASAIRRLLRQEHIWANTNDAPLAVAVPQSGDRFTWSASLTPGAYDVYARWTANPNRATNAQYTVTSTAGQNTVTANQQANGGAWNLLGRYTFGTSGTVSLTSAADGTVIADAVKFVAPGAAYDTATWSPNVNGTYDVFARWSANPNRATNAQYTVTHAGGQDTVTANQQLYGGAWNRLGTYTLTPQSTIALSSAANGYVIADALRLLRSTSSQPATLHYVHTDQLGTPRAVLTQQGSALWTWGGEAFGNTPANEDADGDGVAFAYNLRLPGQYFDAETGSHYNYFRDCYDPQTGRYCQPDPLGLDGGSLSLYSYAKNNPLINVDPLGLCDDNCSCPDRSGLVC